MAVLDFLDASPRSLPLCIDTHEIYSILKVVASLY